MVTHQVAILNSSDGSRHDGAICLVLSALPRACDQKPVNDGATINGGPGVSDGATQATPRLNRHDSVLKEDNHEGGWNVDRLPDKLVSTYALYTANIPSRSKSRS